MFCVNDDILTLFLQMRYVSNVGGVTVVLQSIDKGRGFHELVKEIESQSAYKRQPPLEKKYMSVPEMGRLLGLKKTDRY